ncbi:hypothetical protein J4E89_008991 [Alternaria sp. Ai002NY15]|nr:hypothetical protein J4E89_008991 [Alternaria sp. Ai002NY15]
MDTAPAAKSEPPPSQEAQTVRPPMRRMHSDETERPSSAQRTKDEVDDEADAAAEQQSEDEESDPAQKIVDFDWEDLEARYHDAMKTCHNQEDLLMQEWDNLMNVQLPLLYFCPNINVVKAFESALNLLKASGLGR